ncbi:hypothetical protein BX600DRAFT_546822 [Xylariales sp. PMI_506]|nr:hypothetical protein BX600DRAFT_546822 [Xylariales sp. PMI_506]
MKSFRQIDSTSASPGMACQSIHGHGTSQMQEGYPDQLATLDPPQVIVDDHPIPLICTICPKNSKFSDVSHLLTHIASKGHLSNMFQLDIAKNTDDSARHALDAYNIWFETFNIRGLLQSRSENRQQRISRGRGRSISNSANQTAELSLGHLSATDNDIFGTRSARRGKSNNAMTSSDQMKSEPNPEGDLESTLQPSDHMSHLYGWEGVRRTPDWSGLDIAYLPPRRMVQSDIDAHPVNGEGEDGDNEYGRSSNIYQSLGGGEDMQDNVDVSSGHISEDMNKRAITDEEANTKVTLSEEERERIHFSKYLKGEVLPGMGGFDAATKDERRRRNQKKDPAVLAVMEQNSQAVGRTEHVRNFDLEVQRERDVYDEPSLDGSDDEAEEPEKNSDHRDTPKKKQIRKAQALVISKAADLPKPFNSPAAKRGSRGRRGRVARATRGTASRNLQRRESSGQDSELIGRSIRSARSQRGRSNAALSKIVKLRTPGLGRIPTRGLDVFRDDVEPSPGEGWIALAKMAGSLCCF